jgi:hypothetical protein
LLIVIEMMLNQFLVQSAAPMIGRPTRRRATGSPAIRPQARPGLTVRCGMESDPDLELMLQQPKRELQTPHATI